MGAITSQYIKCAKAPEKKSHGADKQTNQQGEKITIVNRIDACDDRFFIAQWGDDVALDDVA